ncbi:MAG TPA: outer membrane porin GjpA [Mycobacterium sp.]|uniref:outer membrane porin GjpA n=1 Tax=Mycolicibacterium sp. TaxID=2320850 RepID=UPI0025F6C61C|nr:outer membrane porin GjpA [Mycolicibacterium sp.]HPX35110.1 outer membrane porin GjpA [Mycobacterium sp.]HQC75524.1 outer membrane porin GjpA [Mycobacterium sp.]
MQVSARSYLTAGVAAIGAGAMALSPVQPITARSALSPVVTKAMAVNLASAIDPITPIVTTIQTTLANTTTLLSNWIATPFPILQTVANNWLSYFNELPDIGSIVSQMFGNIPKAFQAPFDPGTISEGPTTPLLKPPAGIANGNNISTIPFTTLWNQRTVYSLLTTTGFLTDDVLASLQPVLNTLQTPASGVLLGLLGPVVGPLVALYDGVDGAIKALQTQDWTTAINDLINIPTAMINAALNGTTLNLSRVISLPPELTSIGLALGGLLTAYTSPAGVLNPGTQVGGVGFDSLTVTATFPNPIPGLPAIVISDPGIGIGLVGGLVGLTRFIADAISVPTPATGAAKVAIRRAPAAARAAKNVAKPTRPAAAVRRAR